MSANVRPLLYDSCLIYLLRSKLFDFSYYNYLLYVYYVFQIFHHVLLLLLWFPPFLLWRFYVLKVFRMLLNFYFIICPQLILEVMTQLILLNRILLTIRLKYVVILVHYLLTSSFELFFNVILTRF